MTDKKLLTMDLCSRLPYIDTMVRWQDEDYHMISIGFGRVTLVKPFMSITSGSPLITEIKPYLHPMSSMTEKEKKKFDNFCAIDEFVWKGNYEIGYKNQAIIMSDAIDYLNKHHFDYRGLIEKGLALEAPEGMYKF